MSASVFHPDENLESMEQSGAKDQEENEDQGEVEESVTGKDADKDDDKSAVEEKEDKDNHNDDGVYTRTHEKRKS